MSERIDVQYRRHRIIAAFQKGKPSAFVYKAYKAEDEKIHAVDGTTLNSVVEQAKSWIDELIGNMVSKRRKNYVPTKAEYLDALKSLSIAPHHRVMLSAHANAPCHAMTATELANAAGYDSYESANAHYGKLGHQIAEFLEVTPPPSESRDEPVWTMVLADGVDDAKAGRYWQWIMHPELVDALHELNIT